ncbi:MAG: histidine acid phosphatase [Bacteroidales bacterium]|nr:histidine acid phosphatase [Bacteroidales bacterium]
MKRFCLLCLLALSLPAWAQTSREELLTHLELTAGNYANYPVPTTLPTPAPEGYEPFYISHYGRHGARYMTSDRSYKRLLSQLDTAGSLDLLTDYGKDVFRRIRVAAADAKDRAGELTLLGARQHRAIARRMFDRHPALLRQPLKVVANSSDSRRVMLSMANFCLELKALNPSLEISMDASQHDLYYIKSNKDIVIPETPSDGVLYGKLKQFKQKMLSGDRQMALVFQDPERAVGFIDKYTFADDLYNVAADMKCLPELELSFDDLFGEEGLIDGFRAYNASWCLWEGLMPGAAPGYYQNIPLLQNFLDEADAMIASGGSGLRLRFGHDSILLPFTYLLGIREAVNATDDMEDLHHHFALFRLIPMAGNVQLVFYRKAGSDDILVKFLMNENETSVPVATDCYPYYHWSDVSRYYRDLIEAAHVTYKTPADEN